MGGVINRGTKDRPLWYIRYVDSDGKRKQRKTGSSSPNPFTPTSIADDRIKAGVELQGMTIRVAQNLG